MPTGFQTVRAELVATVLQISAEVGERVESAGMLVLLDSMKMEIPVLAESGGTVSQILVSVGDVVREGDALAVVSVGSA
jgi:acetyl-CoA carboxylase biotin carboxyl carrier protein